MLHGSLGYGRGSGADGTYVQHAGILHVTTGKGNHIKLEPQKLFADLAHARSDILPLRKKGSLHHTQFLAHFEQASLGMLYMNLQLWKDWAYRLENTCLEIFWGNHLDRLYLNGCSRC